MYLIDLPKQPLKLGYARIYFGICRHFSILLCNPHRSVMFSWHNVFGELSYTNMYLVIIRVCTYFRCSWQKFCCQYSICISSWRRWSRWLARLLKFRLLWQDMQHNGFQIRVAGNFIKKVILVCQIPGVVAMYRIWPQNHLQLNFRRISFSHNLLLHYLRYFRAVCIISKRLDNSTGYCRPWIYWDLRYRWLWERYPILQQSSESVFYLYIFKVGQ